MEGERRGTDARDKETERRAERKKQRAEGRFQRAEGRGQRAEGREEASQQTIPRIWSWSSTRWASISMIRKAMLISADPTLF